MPRENINAGSSALSGVIANAQAMQNTATAMTQGIQQGLNSAMSYFSEYRDHLLKRRQLEEQTKANKDLLLEKARQFDTQKAQQDEQFKAQHALNQRQMAINEKVGKAQAWNMSANANATHEQTKQMMKDYKNLEQTPYLKNETFNLAAKQDTQAPATPSPASSSSQPSPATQPAQSQNAPLPQPPLLAARKNTQDLPTQRF